MSARQAPDTLPATIQGLQRQIDAIVKTSGQGSKYSRTGESMGSITFVGPTNDYDTYDFTAKITYVQTPIWPGEDDYPGILTTYTVTNVDDGTVYETGSWVTSGTLPWVQLTQAEYDALDPPVDDTLYIIIG